MSFLFLRSPNPYFFLFTGWIGVVRPRCRPRVTRRGFGVPQSRQRPLRSSGDRKQGIKSIYVPQWKQKGDLYSEWTFLTRSTMTGKGDTWTCKSFALQTIDRISYARSVTQSRLWCMRWKCVPCIDVEHRTVHFFLDRIGIFTVRPVDTSTMGLRCTLLSRRDRGTR